MPKKKPPPGDNVISISPPPDGKTQAENIARALVHSQADAGETMRHYLPKQLQDQIEGHSIEIVLALDRLVTTINRGDLRDVEGMLVGQAHALNQIFHDLARRAKLQTHIDPFDRFLKLALRAQNQSRMTLETLAAIKNPPNLAFVKQANVAQVQQVNNGAPPAAGPLAAASAQPNDSTLPLEQLDGNTLDTGTAAAAGSDDPTMATVGEIHRPKKRQGQS